MKKIKNSLVVQGGGFRTAFTAGVLDCFLLYKYTSFDHLIGVSAGAIAISYFLGEQYGSHYEAAHHMIKDPNFLNVKNALSEKGYMNIDYLRTVAENICPFNMDKALENLAKSKVEFVATDMANGEPVFLEPNKKNWVDTVIASSTLPFVTKGTHKINGQELMDGGWSDPLPVNRAYQLGAKKMVVIGTLPYTKIKQSWPDYLASLYYRKDQARFKVFNNNHEVYNQSIEFISNPPKEVEIDYLAPSKTLQSGTYNKSSQSLLNDYRHGMHVAMDYLHSKSS
ncbi:MAG: patatin family protein [Flavobacteriales bacterium]|nr:patatin family protein [Flavobacteriales bacterium]